MFRGDWRIGFRDIAKRLAGIMLPTMELFMKRRKEEQHSPLSQLGACLDILQILIEVFRVKLFDNLTNDIRYCCSIDLSVSPIASARGAPRRTPPALVLPVWTGRTSGVMCYPIRYPRVRVGAAGCGDARVVRAGSLAWDAEPCRAIHVLQVYPKNSLRFGINCSSVSKVIMK